MLLMRRCRAMAALEAWPLLMLAAGGKRGLLL
jgi:hypothetical protein